MTAYDTANQAMQDTLNAIEASETAAEATIRELREKLAGAEKSREAESLLERCLRQLNSPARAVYAGTFIHEDIQKWIEARRIAGEGIKDE